MFILKPSLFSVYVCYSLQVNMLMPNAPKWSYTHTLKNYVDLNFIKIICYKVLKAYLFFCLSFRIFCYLLLFQPLSYRQLAYICIYEQLFFNYQTIICHNLPSTQTLHELKHVEHASTQSTKTRQAHKQIKHVSTQSRQARSLTDSLYV